MATITHPCSTHSSISHPTFLPSIHPAQPSVSHPAFLPSIYPSTQPSHLSAIQPSFHPSIHPAQPSVSHRSIHLSVIHPSFHPSIHPPSPAICQPSFHPPVSHPSFLPSIHQVSIFPSIIHPAQPSVGHTVAEALAMGQHCAGLWELDVDAFPTPSAHCPVGHAQR